MRARRTKYEALRVPCPRCGVYEWKPCVSKDERERKSFHIERHAKARADKWRPKPKSTAESYGKEWAATRAKVFALKGSQCVYCQADASHVDHQTPKSRGGTNHIDNLVPCCARCNISKGIMTLEEWRP